LAICGADIARLADLETVLSKKIREVLSPSEESPITILAAHAVISILLAVLQVLAVCDGWEK